MLRGTTYEEVTKAFRWKIPSHYNIGIDVCDKWAYDKQRIALIYQDPGGSVRKFTYRQLKTLSNRLANALKAGGIGNRCLVHRKRQSQTGLSSCEISSAQWLDAH